MHLNRSYLYVPAEAGPRLWRARSRGADAVIADLEDSVAPARKAQARVAAAEWLAEADGGDRVESWIRVNPGEAGLDDIRHTFRRGLAGVCVTKADGSAQLARMDEALSDLEREHGVAAGTTAVMPLIETARGMRAVFDIAEAPRVRLLQIGEIDLAADLGLSPDPDGAELAPLRSEVVLASSVAHLLPPVGAVSAEFQDLTAFARSTSQLKRAGFVGRAAIHPRQLISIHQAFHVSAEEEAAAVAVVARYEDAQLRGTGAITGPDGRMVDEATVRQSHRTIWLAEATRRTSERTSA